MRTQKRALFAEFIEWTKKKFRYHTTKQKEKIYVHEGQIWWAALGKNVGFEMDGKHGLFHRPVLILKKYNEHICFVLPITTQVKNPLPWYQVCISGHRKRRAVNLSQGRTISSKRLLEKQADLSLSELRVIRQFFQKQFT